MNRITRQIGVLCLILILGLSACKPVANQPATQAPLETSAAETAGPETPGSHNATSTARAATRAARTAQTPLAAGSPVPGISGAAATGGAGAGEGSPGAATTAPAGITTPQTGTGETPLPGSASPSQAAQSGQPSGESVVGIHLDDLNSEQQLSLFQQAEARWVRFDNFHWDVIEPQDSNPPAYLWDQVNETGLRNAADRGMKIIGMILYAPRWAQKYPGLDCGPVAEAALPRFGQFVNALVSRYSQPPYNVHIWEIGNEPDISRVGIPPHLGFGCWGEPNDQYYGGGYYADMLKVVYPQIKAADPNSQVLVGGLLLDCDPNNPPETSPGSGQPKDCSAAHFLEGILKNGGGDFFDAVSFHAYDYYAASPGVFGNGNWASAWNTSGPVLVAKARFLKKVLSDNGYPNKGLLNTEVALLCVPEESAPCTTGSATFVETKADYAAEANAAAIAEGLSANIWYSLIGWRLSGLVDANLQPNTAFQAMHFSAKELAGAAFVGEATSFPGVKGYEFERSGTRIWVLWSGDGQQHTVQVPSQPSAVFDVVGSPLTPEANVTVDVAPVYIEFMP